MLRDTPHGSEVTYAVFHLFGCEVDSDTLFTSTVASRFSYLELITQLEKGRLPVA